MTQNIDILDRFTGSDGFRNVVRGLFSQKLCGNSEAIATKLASLSIVHRYAPGEMLFLQDDASNDIFFILSGSVSIQINGREVNTRKAGQHIGEMSAIDVQVRRSASVLATTETVTARISEPDFAAVATEYPSVWRELACELGERLRQRVAKVPKRNNRPRLFVGSSAEGLGVARAIQSGLQYDSLSVKVWTDGVFQASNAAMEDLEREIHLADFGLLVLTPDDTTESRGSTTLSPRDNVLFELGLLMGAIGRTRTFSLQPREVQIKTPSDLFGIKPITYLLAEENEVAIALAPACSELRTIIYRLGAK